MKTKLPEEWKEVELKDVCNKITDGTHKTPKYINKGIPFISTNNLDPTKQGFDFSQYEKYISKEEYKELTKRCKPEKGDILISKCGTIGRTKLVDVDYEFSIFVGLALLKLDKSKIYDKYLEMLLNSDRYFEIMSKLAPGSTRKTLTISAIEKIPLVLPPLATQKKIVSILEKSEQAKEMRKNADELTKDFLKSIFIEMFGGPYKNKNNFKIKKVNEIVDLINGRAFKPSDWFNKGLKIIRIQNLNNPDAEFNYFNGEIEDKHLVEKGDLLLSWSGTPGTSFGVFIWNGEKSVLNQHIFNVKIREKSLNKIYFQYFINAKLVELISKAHGGVGLQHITKAELDNVDFFLPPIELQNKFVSIVKEVEAMKEQQKHSKEQIDNLFNTLMQKAFKGELI